MIADIGNIMLKEWREVLLQRGNIRGGWFGLAIMLGVFGIYMPAQSGRGWVESPAALAVWLWVPFFLVSSIVADSFAGERERHTLETLLASRLSDRAILIGKVAAAVGYAWGLTMLMLLLGVVTVNVLNREGGFLFFPLPMFAGIVLLTLLGATLISCIGVLVSLRASTVRQAAQALSIASMLLVFVPIFGFQALPNEMRRQMFEFLGQLNVANVVIAVGVGLLALDALFLALALARFQRAKLILD